MVTAVVGIVTLGLAVAIVTGTIPFADSTVSTGSTETTGSPGFTGSTEPTAADGRVTDGGGVSPFDDSHPTISRLDPALLTALREAATAVEQNGSPLHVNSGWRSAEYQRWLQDEALEKYGSAEEASRWVSSPENSAHVTGDAVDIGPYATAEWLSRRGAQFGLCQIYANEIWHFELRPDAPVEGCPEMYADASEVQGSGS